MINITTYDTTKGHQDKKEQVLDIVRSARNQKSLALFFAVFHGKLHAILFFMLFQYVFYEYYWLSHIESYRGLTILLYISITIAVLFSFLYFYLIMITTEKNEKNTYIRIENLDKTFTEKSDKNNEMWLALDSKNQVMGCASIEKSQKDKEKYVIENLYVRQQYRKMGVSKLLLDNLAYYAYKKGIEKVYFTMIQDMPLLDPYTLQCKGCVWIDVECKKEDMVFGLKLQTFEYYIDVKEYLQNKDQNDKKDN